MYSICLNVPRSPFMGWIVLDFITRLHLINGIFYYLFIWFLLIQLLGLRMQTAYLQGLSKISEGGIFLTDKFPVHLSIWGEINRNQHMWSATYKEGRTFITL